MTEARDAGKRKQPNIETLEGRTLLSSAVGVAAFAAAAEKFNVDSPPGLVKIEHNANGMSTLAVDFARLGVPMRSTVIAIAVEAQQLAERANGGGGIDHGFPGTEFGIRGGHHRMNFDRGSDSDEGAGGWTSGKVIIGGANVQPPVVIVDHRMILTPAPSTPEPAAPPADAVEAPAGSTGAIHHHQQQHQQSTQMTANVKTETRATSSTTVPRIVYVTVPGGGETKLAEAVDAVRPTAATSKASGAAAAVSRAGTAFSGLFSRTAIDGGVATTVTRAARALVAAADALPAVARTVQTALSSPRRFFHIERLSDPMMLIGDAAATFAEESALLGTSMQADRYVKAWGITAGVVAFDAAVLMYWMQTRKRTRRVAGCWGFDMAGGEIE